MNQTNDNWPTVAYIETDRFCTECGYNLRQQTVMRHPDLDILLCRCPECGRHHAASESTTIGNLWLRRVGRLGLMAWVMGLLAAVLGLGMAESGLMFGTLHELTSYRYQYDSTRELILVIREFNRGLFAFVTIVGVLSFANGAILGVGVVTLAYHWRRRRYFLLVLVIPTLVAAVIFSMWCVEAPHLMSFGLVFILGHVGAYILGGGLGVTFGRPLARAAIRAILPPRFWPVLGDLWLVDQKPLPQPQKADT